MPENEEGDPVGNEPSTKDNADVNETDRVKKLRERERKAIDSDADPPSESDESNDPETTDVPGGAGLRSIRYVTPFLFFMQVYADNLYPDRKTPERRINGFRKDHKHIFRFLWTLDLAIQIILIALILAGPIVITINGVKATLGL